MGKWRSAMRVFPVDRVKGGWFVGHFTDSAYQTDEFEVAYKTHSAGESWPTHYHKIATEINYVIHGTVRVNGVEFAAPAIYVHPPGEIASIEFLDDVEMIVVKTPSLAGDKYEVHEP